jgi:hypothetical protein
MLHRLLTGLFTGSPQIKALRDATAAWKRLAEAHEERVQRLEIEVKRLNATVEEHYAQLHKVRGKVYGTASRNGSGQGNIPFGDKQALREYVGLSHARRFNHDNEE